MATENRDWGYTRIRRALDNLDHQVARGTVANVLKAHGLEPAPERRTRTTWREFLAAHWDVLAAADFFTVEVWTSRGETSFVGADGLIRSFGGAATSDTPTRRSLQSAPPPPPSRNRTREPHVSEDPLSTRPWHLPTREVPRRASTYKYKML